MNRLWSYKDYVERLSHPSYLVRRWAFNAIENRYPRTCEPEVANLIGDENEHLACSAPRYLAEHQAAQFAPAIFESFKRDKRLIPGNCAIALGQMRYEAVMDEILNRLSNCENLNTFIGICEYLARIPSEENCQVLRDLFTRVEGEMEFTMVAQCLLHHRQVEDARLVFDVYPDLSDKYFTERFLRIMADSTGGETVFTDLLRHGAEDLLARPTEVISEVVADNVLLGLHGEVLDNIEKKINRRQYHDLATLMAFSAQQAVTARFPRPNPQHYLHEMFQRDTLALAFLNEFAKRHSRWRRAAKDPDLAGSFVATFLAFYFSIIGRKPYLAALSPQAGRQELIEALKHAGAKLPQTIQDRASALLTTEDFKSLFSENLSTWGDIWTVRLMGKIGDSAYVEDLTRIVHETDGLYYVHEDAIRSINALDEEAHELILARLRGEKVIETLDIFAILEHLPYREAFDIALRQWNNHPEDQEGYVEMFALCLEGIGDSRGIEVLQAILTSENATLIGDSIEILCSLYDRKIPELHRIHLARKIHKQQQNARNMKLDKLASALHNAETDENEPLPPKITPFKRKSPKIGRNDPCPCGSGNKFKKCCLNKND